MFEILFPALLTGLLLSLITAPLGAFVVCGVKWLILVIPFPTQPCLVWR